ncbi:MAG: alpha/beta fold hydrolase [Gemmatimonadetes bacterium]|nr:alpha/beta fold hydrolase [Gemmatimonadota bacterium]
MATPRLTSHTLAGALGPLLVDLRTSDRAHPRPAVLIVHGFKGFKDWGMFPPFADRVARAGFTAVSVNLSGSGVDASGEFSLPERFGRNTYSAELADLAAVLDGLHGGSLEIAPPSHVGIVGHSRGGGVAILAAARDARIHALVTWAAIADVHRWRGREAEWRAAGTLQIVNARTGQVLPLYPSLLDDVERNPVALDIRAAAARLTQPWLLLHGAEDEAVPIVEADALAAGWRPEQPRRRVTIAGGGHTFGAVHPFAGMTPALSEVFDESLNWLGRYL